MADSARATLGPVEDEATSGDGTTPATPPDSDHQRPPAAIGARCRGCDGPIVERQSIQSITGVEHIEVTCANCSRDGLVTRDPGTVTRLRGQLFRPSPGVWPRAGATTNSKGVISMTEDSTDCTDRCESCGESPKGVNMAPGEGWSCPYCGHYNTDRENEEGSAWKQ